MKTLNFFSQLKQLGITGFVISLLVLTGCSKSPTTTEEGDSLISERQELIEIPVSSNYEEKISFQLVDGQSAELTNLDLNFHNCASGYNPLSTGPEGSTSIAKLIDQDRNCRAELHEFVLNGDTYRNPASYDRSATDEENAGTFIGAEGDRKTLREVVEEGVEPREVTVEAVKFLYSVGDEVVDDLDEIVLSIFQNENRADVDTTFESQDIQISATGLTSPKVRIVGGENSVLGVYAGYDPASDARHYRSAHIDHRADGKGDMEIFVECEEAITTEGDSKLCDGYTIEGMKALLFVNNPAAFSDIPGAPDAAKDDQGADLTYFDSFDYDEIKALWEAGAADNGEQDGLQARGLLILSEIEADDIVEDGEMSDDSNECSILKRNFDQLEGEGEERGACKRFVNLAGEAGHTNEDGSADLTHFNHATGYVFCTTISVETDDGDGHLTHAFTCQNIDIFKNSAYVIPEQEEAVAQQAQPQQQPECPEGQIPVEDGNTGNFVCLGAEQAEQAEP